MIENNDLSYCIDTYGKIFPFHLPFEFEGRLYHVQESKEEEEDKFNILALGDIKMLSAGSYVYAQAIPTCALDSSGEIFYRSRGDNYSNISTWKEYLSPNPHEITDKYKPSREDVSRWTREKFFSNGYVESNDNSIELKKGYITRVLQEIPKEEHFQLVEAFVSLPKGQEKQIQKDYIKASDYSLPFTKDISRLLFTKDVEKFMNSYASHMRYLPIIRDVRRKKAERQFGTNILNTLSKRESEDLSLETIQKITKGLTSGILPMNISDKIYSGLRIEGERYITRITEDYLPKIQRILKNEQVQTRSI